MLEQRPLFRVLARTALTDVLFELTTDCFVMTATVDAVLDQVDRGLDQARERLFDLLRIPSISTDPAHEQDVRRAADWLRDQLAGLGFKVAVKPTAGHPVVLGYHPGLAGSKAPRILFYGHYDVQPPDPVQLWTSSPFDPQL
jgi:acetylornithine deacetylase/succinyl-diaminopimelate desuccinylase-like protein